MMSPSASFVAFSVVCVSPSSSVMVTFSVKYGKYGIVSPTTSSPFWYHWYMYANLSPSGSVEPLAVAISMEFSSTSSGVMTTFLGMLGAELLVAASYSS